MWMTLLMAAHVSDAALRAEFIKSRDVTTLSLKATEAYAGFGQRYLKELLAAGTARNWIVGRQLIDLVQEFPDDTRCGEIARTDPATRTTRLFDRVVALAKLARKHICSSRRCAIKHTTAPGRVWRRTTRRALKKGAKVRVKLKPNKHFTLPASDRDIIMVGPGTGVAPFRAFVQERRAADAKGRSWLFFGDRTFTHDFLYQTEWQDALKDGALTRMDVAFSRDTPEKVYVQNRIWEKRRDLIEWLDGGATLYVCGDMNAMAKDVRSTLARAYADVKSISPEDAETTVATLERDKRYQQDVY